MVWYRGEMIWTNKDKPISFLRERNEKRRAGVQEPGKVNSWLAGWLHPLPVATSAPVYTPPTTYFIRKQQSNLICLLTSNLSP